jgi:hypothetical protein
MTRAGQRACDCEKRCADHVADFPGISRELTEVRDENLLESSDSQFLRVSKLTPLRQRLTVRQKLSIGGLNYSHALTCVLKGHCKVREKLAWNRQNDGGKTPHQKRINEILSSFNCTMASSFLVI